MQTIRQREGDSRDKISNTQDVIANGFHGYKEGYEKLEKIGVTSRCRKFVDETFMPLFLMITTPNVALLMWYTAVKCDGSYTTMSKVFTEKSFLGGLVEIWSSVPIVSPFSIGVLMGYCAWALTLMKILPGKTVSGPITPKGNVPIYVDNGFAHYIVSMVSLCLLTVVLKMYGLTPTVIYDRFDEFVATLTIFSLLFCLYLYLKGLYSPSSSDNGSSGNFIFDYYWGTELYPRVFGIDIKVFTNCRFGMTIWALLVAIYALKSYEMHGFVDSMFVSMFLQLIYITKFFWWEAGYMSTIDIMVDRAGYYICWGCLVFVPSFYTSVSLYLVNHPVHLGTTTSIAILLAGMLSIAINFLADWQKQHVRGANGNCLIWGKKPDIIRAKYQLENGQEKESILLASGWWGLARHFHYLAEILLTFFWTIPALFVNVMPFSYLIFLIVLLVHRSYRDDDKCGSKYGTFWTEYRKRVPHRIIPLLF